MKTFKKTLFLLFLSLSCLQGLNSQTVFTIDVTRNNHEISPYIYGVAYKNYPYAKAKTLNGQRFTSFNWENNASGDLYFADGDANVKYHLDAWLPYIMGVEDDKFTTSGAVAKVFIEDCYEHNQMPVMMLPMAGFVASDTLCANLLPAPSGCWKSVEQTNPNGYTFPPNLNDDVVYISDYVKYINDNLIDESIPHGYFLDNEPEGWSRSHTLLVNAENDIDTSNNIAYKSYMSKTIDIARTIRKNDASALIFGPSYAGFNGHNGLGFAKDWGDYLQKFPSFTAYYLDSISTVEEKENIKILDVFDIHWYPIDEQIKSDVTTDEMIGFRLQSPRTLWDNNFRELYSPQGDSDYSIRTLKSLFDTYGLDLKLSIGEYFYGAPNHISGGIAQADALGIFGKEDIYLASLFPNGNVGQEFNDDLSGYIKTAFDLYLNYDKKGSHFGTESVFSETQDTMASVYTSIDESTGHLHIIAINKDLTYSKTVKIETNYDKPALGSEVFWYDYSQEEIQEDKISIIDSKNFEFLMPPASVSHIILKSISSYIDYSYQNDIEIFPNPAQEFINIENKSGNKIQQVEIFNTSGIMIKKINDSFDHIQTNFFNNGVYFLKIMIDNQIVVKPITILHL